MLKVVLMLINVPFDRYCGSTVQSGESDNKSVFVNKMMELSCVVRREVKLLSRRRCYFSDAVLKPSCFVDILPDSKVAANFTIAKSKEIGVQCEACNISALKVSIVIKFVKIETLNSTALFSD